MSLVVSAAERQGRKSISGRVEGHRNFGLMGGLNAFVRRYGRDYPIRQHPGKEQVMSDRTIIELDEAESLKLVSRGGIGRIAYQSRFGPAVLPVNYQWHDGAVVFRTTRHSALDEDLQTGIANGDYLVAFEVDEIDVPGRQGWSVLIQGPAHHVSEAERESAERAGVEPWPAGERELFMRIVPDRVTGRRIKPAG
jgi:nitroimidazol reductase NimA-like FMN-containing flavoprotein (pyridoxamine 5'-phosphate oxidase superfamily)